MLCRFCQYRFSEDELASEARDRMFNLGFLVLLLVIIGFGISECSSSVPDLPGSSSYTPPAEPAISDADREKCREAIGLAERRGLIMSRPQGDRLDVDERVWAELPAESKRLLMQAVACDVWGHAMPPNLESVAVYGYRSGKRLALLTAVGLDFE